MMTYFDSIKVPVIAHGIDLMEQGVITGKTNLQFAKDIITSVIRQYAHFTEEEVHPIGQYGDFFPTVVANPSVYIESQPELKQTLLMLKNQGKKLFVGTNSHFEYMHVIMKATFGDDWEQIFDLKLANCRKPLFFRDPNAPFYVVDESARDLKGTSIANGADLQPNFSYLEGNANIVHQYYQRVLSKD